MNKFTSLISSNGNETLKRRASIIAQNAEVAQQNLVNELKQKKTELELRIADLTDLAPESTESLRPGTKDWDAKKWVKDLQQAKQDKYMNDIQLKLAEETFNEYFKESSQNS